MKDFAAKEQIPILVRELLLPATGAKTVAPVWSEEVVREPKLLVVTEMG